MEELEKKEIFQTYKWIKIKKYKDDDTLTWEERYQRLEQHHIEETNFLIDKIREIVKKYKDDSTLSWEERYRLLEQHHIEETNFLIDKVREIVKNI